MSCDENYLPYAAVTIASIARHADPRRNYQIFILYDKLQNSLKYKLLHMQKRNITIEFIQMGQYIKTYKPLFHTQYHFTESAYYRFFIPIIFNSFEKILYCDCDGLFIKDCKEIYDFKFDGLLAVVRDIWMGITTQENPNLYNEYFKKILGLSNINNYFNSGLMLFNIKKCIDINLTDKCLKKLEEVQNPKWVDQCIFNVVCENIVDFLPLSYNVLINLILKYPEGLENKLSSTDYNDYMASINDPIYLHFAAFPKPWGDESEYSFFFWENAKNTPFYESLLINRLEKQLIIPLSERINCLEGRFISLQKQIDRLESWSLRENIKKTIKFLLPPALYLKLKKGLSSLRRNY